MSLLNLLTIPLEQIDCSARLCKTYPDQLEFFPKIFRVERVLEDISFYASEGLAYVDGLNVAWDHEKVKGLQSILVRMKPLIESLAREAHGETFDMESYLRSGAQVFNCTMLMIELYNSMNKNMEICCIYLDTLQPMGEEEIQGTLETVKRRREGSGLPRELRDLFRNLGRKEDHDEN